MFAPLAPAETRCNDEPHRGRFIVDALADLGASAARRRTSTALVEPISFSVVGPWRRVVQRPPDVWPRLARRQSPFRKMWERRTLIMRARRAHSRRRRARPARPSAAGRSPRPRSRSGTGPTRSNGTQPSLARTIRAPAASGTLPRPPPSTEAATGRAEWRSPRRPASPSPAPTSTPGRETPTRRSAGQGKLVFGGLRPRRRAADLAPAAPLARAPAPPRRRHQTARAVRIRAREDRPLRRCPTPSAARDRAARARGLRVVAVDRNEGRSASRPRTSQRSSTSWTSTRAEVGGSHGVDGALTVSADRAVPVVAAVTERLGLPG